MAEYTQKMLQPHVKDKTKPEHVVQAVNDSIDEYGLVKGTVSYVETERLQTGGKIISRRNNLKNLVFGHWTVENYPTEKSGCNYETRRELETALDDCLEDVRYIVGDQFIVEYDARKSRSNNKASILVKRLEEPEKLASDTDDLTAAELRAQIDKEIEAGYH